MAGVAIPKLLEAERSGSAAAAANPMPCRRRPLPSSAILRQLNNVSAAAAAAAVAKFQNSIYFAVTPPLSNNLTGYLFGRHNATLPIVVLVREGAVRKDKKKMCWATATQARSPPSEVLSSPQRRMSDE